MTAPTRARARSRRGWVLLLVLAAVAGGGYWYATRVARPDPATVTLPAQHVDDATVRAYFAGPGAPVRALLNKTTTVPVAPTKAGCTRLGADLDGIGRPSVLLRAVAGISDVGIRDAAANHLDSVNRYLNACGTGQDVKPDAQQVSYSATVMDRLLSRAGAR